MTQQNYRSQEYRQQDIMGASPIRLVVMAYDIAINACQEEDFVRATRVLAVLRDALNFDYPEAAVGLFRIYQWVLDCVRVGDYKNAVVSLRELRDAWVEAEQRLSSMSPQAQPQISTQPSALPTRRPLAQA